MELLDSKRGRFCIISFDFKLARGANQARKTKFFRELYGYKQKVKRKLKSGKMVSRIYHYDGILDHLPHVKLGKSVLGVQPGTEGPIIQLLRDFDEVIYYDFIGWLPDTFWPLKQDDDKKVANNLISQFGFLSVLFQVQRLGGSSEESTLLDLGFDPEYLQHAIQYLLSKRMLVKVNGSLESTSKGKQIANSLSL